MWLFFLKWFRKACFIRMEFDCWTNRNFRAKWGNIICQANLFITFFTIFFSYASHVFDGNRRICQENESRKIPVKKFPCPHALAFLFLLSHESVGGVCWHALLSAQLWSNVIQEVTQLSKLSLNERKKPLRSEVVTGNYDRRHLWSSVCYLLTYFTPGIWQL